MSDIKAPLFNILPTVNPIVDDAYRAASVQILADGSQAIDGVVKLDILDREIWLDIDKQAIVKWRDGRSRHDEPVAIPAEATCTSCQGGTEEPPIQYPTGTLMDQSYKRRQATAGRVYDIAEDQTITCIELHVNDKCNFRCDYCYLKSAGIEYLDNEMPQEVARQAIDMLLANIRPGGACVVRFFGGEPFLSYRLMRYVVDYATSEATREGKLAIFTVNTNGSLLNDEKIEWCKKNNVRVTISLDGNEHSNDAVRKFESGNGTYRTVLRKAKHFLKESGYLNLRSTVNSGSFELRDSMVEFSELGESSVVKFQTDYNFVGEGRVTHSEADRLMKEHEELALVCADRLKRGEKFLYGNFVEPMMKAFYSVKTPYRCGAARSMVGISPKGTIYPCHRFIDVRAMEMGSVQAGLDGRQRREFIENRVEFKKPCSECWARYFCGGGCAFNNYFTNGTIEDPNNVHCKMFRHQVKLGLYLYTELHQIEKARTCTPTTDGVDSQSARIEPMAENGTAMSNG
jgi:uncharacterized protein